MSTTKGYIYAELDVTNPEYFNAEYAPRVQPVLQKYGAKFLISGGAPEVREGGRVVKRIVFLEFESLERAREFYDSADYQDVIGYRFDSSRAHLYLLEGTDGGGAAVGS
jgi:uncharacterized protein (DUF1330 family)